MTVLILFLLLFLFMFIGVPIAISLGLSGALTILLFSPLPGVVRRPDDPAVQPELATAQQVDEDFQVAQQRMPKWSRSSAPMPATNRVFTQS